MKKLLLFAFLGLTILGDCTLIAVCCRQDTPASSGYITADNACPASVGSISYTQVTDDFCAQEAVCCATHMPGLTTTNVTTKQQCQGSVGGTISYQIVDKSQCPNFNQQLQQLQQQQLLQQLQLQCYQQNNQQACQQLRQQQQQLQQQCLQQNNQQACQQLQQQLQQLLRQCYQQYNQQACQQLQQQQQQLQQQWQQQYQ